MSEQQENIERVRQKISPKILEFCRLRLHSNPLFHMKELTDFVQAQVGVAPDSPGRILRLLRQAGHINYTVIDRKNSTYQLQSGQAGQLGLFR